MRASQAMQNCVKTGSVVEVSVISDIRHAGSCFAVGTWAATSDGQLFYIADILKLDVKELQGGLNVGMLFLKVFGFTFKQLRAGLRANELRHPIPPDPTPSDPIPPSSINTYACERRIPIRRLVQLLDTCPEVERRSKIPCAWICNRSSAALWQWEAKCFQQLATNEQVAFRPLTWAGVHKLCANGESSSLSAANHDEEALFKFR